MVSLTLAVFGSIQSKALAAVYKWKDDQGKVHFTDDKSKIPLKFRKQTQKMKGMAPPPQTAEESEEGAEKTAEGEKSPDAGSEAKGKPEAAKPPPQNTLTAEQKAALQAVYKPLMGIWGDHILLLRDYELKPKNHNQYARVAQLSKTKKEDLVDTIGETEDPFLEEIYFYLDETATQDGYLQEGMDGLKDWVEAYRNRLLKEIPREKKFVDQIARKLDLGVPPLQTLDEIMEEGKRRRESRKKKKSKNREEFERMMKEGQL